jgi:hypothetical protein
VRLTIIVRTDSRFRPDIRTAYDLASKRTLKLGTLQIHLASLEEHSQDHMLEQYISLDGVVLVLAIYGSNFLQNDQ